MSRMVGAATARLRLALVGILAGTGAVLIISLLATTTSSPSGVALAAVAVAIAAVVAQNRLTVTPVSSRLGLPLRSADDVPALQTGHVTDSPRNPLRPRAPGLV